MAPSIAVLCAAAAVILPMAPVRAQQADPVPAAFAGLPAIRFEYYAVRGNTQAELATALREAAQTTPGLTEPGQPPAAGRTRWKADFAWDAQRRTGLCRTRSPRTTMTVIVILPRLAEPERITPAARAAWQDYIAGIERHEAGHARIAFAHVRDFESEAYGAPCDRIRAMGQRIVDRIVALQEDYERRTDYGRAQGDIVE